MLQYACIAESLLYQFDDNHRSGVALANTGFDDTRIAALAILVFRSHFIKEFLYYILIHRYVAIIRSSIELLEACQYLHH